MDPFKWQPFGDTGLVLTYRGCQFARLERWADGRWMAIFHYPPHPIEQMPPRRVCRSRETGIAGIEMWATRHRAGICAWIDRGFDASRLSIPGRGNAEKSDRPGSDSDAS